MKITLAALAIVAASANAQRKSAPQLRQLQEVGSIAAMEAPTSDESSTSGDGSGGMSSSKSGKGSKKTCGPADFNGIYQYMATSGGNGGKLYTITMSYDPSTEKNEGLFSITASGMSNANFLTVFPDDSAFKFFDEDDFKINDDGVCTFVPEGDMTCPLYSGGAGVEDRDGTDICAAYFGAPTGEAANLCTVEGTADEAQEPDCGFEVTAEQRSDNTWAIFFPGFATTITRLAIRA